MNPKFLPFSNMLAKECTDISIRSQALPYIVAMAVAKTMPIPSSPVQEVSNYFRTTHGIAVRNTIADINEQLVFDTPLALSLTGVLWEARYNAAHPQKLNMLSIRDACNGGIFAAMTGASLALSADQMQFMECHKQLLLTASEYLYDTLSVEG